MPPRPDFTSSRRKLERAAEHHRFIKDALPAYTSNEPIAVETRHNLSGNDDAIHFTYLVTTGRQPPPGWSLALGDAVQNIRASLDHAMWAIVIAAKGLPFAERNARKIQFPISDKGVQTTSLAHLGVSPTYLGVIEQAQPYHQRPTSPRDDALWFLATLSNVDKHRLLHTVAVVAEIGRIQTDPPLAGGYGEFVQKGALRPGDEVVRFTAERPAGYRGGNVDINLQFGVSIEATSSTSAIPIDQALTEMRSRAKDIIDRLSRASRER